ncbi:hypothetical protein K458DRAFT_437278 [Lentithecium fluviatile CBS 122367]|uniref:Ecp2 effector protein domain-containing protein n=1 Tax=Lentithecium fluviatile CBS 122367 TaxID=1168545 RepID=A0A6G1IDR8_9PLEO|nr:hypothetical protein K458DRAFT_437278 [Lentithecium fluviatile CBS 122367]
MLSLKVCAILLSFTSSITLAAPVSDESPNPLAKRVTYGDGSSKDKPLRGIFRIEGWTDLAEIDCYIMLCIIGSSIFQRGPDSNSFPSSQTTEGGAGNEPFHDDKLDQYGTTRASDSNISPEDFPWRSVQLQPDEHRYLTGGPRAQQDSQGACVINGYKGYYGGDVIGYNKWFEIRIRDEDEHLLGEMCRAWLEDDLSKCGDNKKYNILGAVGVVFAQMVYYYVSSEGRYYHATQKGAKRDLESVQWDIDPEDITWPEIPPDAEEVKRAIVLLDEAGNELARSEKRAVVELDEAGNKPSSSGKRGVVELDEAGNELARSEKRAVVELNEAGNELSSSGKHGVVELDEAGNELSDSEQ